MSDHETRSYELVYREALRGPLGLWPKRSVARRRRRRRKGDDHSGRIASLALEVLGDQLARDRGEAFVIMAWVVALVAWQKMRHMAKPEPNRPSPMRPFPGDGPAPRGGK